MRAPADDTRGADHTAEALVQVNALRAKSNLPALSPDPAAQAAALAQARRMAVAGEMSHLIGFNDSFLERMKGMKVSLPAAENIATGQDTVGRAVEAWINSPKHLHNMLGNYRGLGVAMATSASSAGRPFWAMVLSNGS